MEAMCGVIQVPPRKLGAREAISWRDRRRSVGGVDGSVGTTEAVRCDGACGSRAQLRVRRYSVIWEVGDIGVVRQWSDAMGEVVM